MVFFDGSFVILRIVIGLFFEASCQHTCFMALFKPCLNFFLTLFNPLSFSQGRLQAVPLSSAGYGLPGPHHGGGVVPGDQAEPRGCWAAGAPRHHAHAVDFGVEATNE